MCIRNVRQHVRQHIGQLNALICPALDVWSPVVQVQVLLPETLNDGFGVIRTLVRDSTDAPQPAGAESFLDSDDTVSQDLVSNQTTIETVLVCDFYIKLFY